MAVLKKTIMVSSLPRFLSCPSSEGPCEYPYDAPSEVGDVGTAVHECAEAIVLGTECSPETVAKKYGVDPEETSILTACAGQAWEAMRPHFANPSVEVTLERPGLRGHADVLHYDGDTLAVLDWKTNRVMREYTAQLMGYAACAAHMNGMPKSGVVTVATAWLRFGEIDVRNYSAKDIEGFMTRVDNACHEIDRAYGPGDACTFCRRKFDCGSRIGYLRNAIDVLDKDPLPSEEVKPSQLAEIWQRTRLLKRAIDAYERAVKSMLVDGPIEMSDKSYLELRLENVEKLDAQTAWPIIVEAGLTEADLAKCVRLSKMAVTRALSDRTARGHKGKAIESLLNRLRAAGAIKMEAKQTICKRRKKCQQN